MDSPGLIDTQLHDLCQHPDGFSLFGLHLPDYWPWRGMLSIPHSGEIIPREFTPWLEQDSWALGQDVDFRVHQLIDQKALLKDGIVILKANIHRVACDLNRPPEKAIFNWRKNTLGVPLVKDIPSPQVIEQLLATYHTPYFTIIRQVLSAHEQKPFSFIDLHSMPSHPTAYHQQQYPSQPSERPDFCLSDQQGKTCSSQYIQAMQHQLKAHGYSALLNRPYVGGYITEYAHPYTANNIQIEIKRGVYMNEQKRQLKTNASALLKQRLTLALQKQFKNFNTF